MTKNDIANLIRKDDPNLTNSQFIALCDFLFEGERWGTKVAKIMRCSASHISHIRTNKSEPQPHHTRKLLTYAQKHAGSLLDQRLDSDDPDVKTLKDVPEQTDAEIREKQEDIAHKAGKMIRLLFKRLIPSMVLSGNGGSGKSHLVHMAKKDADLKDTDVITYSGAASAPGIFRLLWLTRDGGIGVLDDCDDALFDPTSMNLLKSALDSTGTRTITYAKNAPWLEAEGIEQTFEYNGSIIFITNYDVSTMAESNSSNAPHLDALMSRSLYVDMTIRSRREMAVRIQTLLDANMLDTIPNPGKHPKFSKRQVKEIGAFIMENRDRFRQFSLRTAINVAHLYRSDKDDWKDLVELTMMRKTN